MKQIAINWDSYGKFGCPHCGCESASSQGMQGGGVSPVICFECKNNFIILADGMIRSTVGFSYPKEQKVPEGGGFVCTGSMVFSLRREDDAPPPEDTDEYYYAELQQHPREGIPKHPFVRPDLRPEGGGEYWAPRGIGYDLSGFVKSKEAGERIVAMFAGALGVTTPKTWLDYREREPMWIQLKVQGSEADLEKLYELTKDTGIITAEIINRVIINKSTDPGLE